MKRQSFITNLGVLSLIGLTNPISLFAKPKTELEALNAKVIDDSFLKKHLSTYSYDFINNNPLYNTFVYDKEGKEYKIRYFARVCEKNKAEKSAIQFLKEVDKMILDGTFGIGVLAKPMKIELISGKIMFVFYSPIVNLNTLNNVEINKLTTQELHNQFNIKRLNESNRFPRS